MRSSERVVFSENLGGVESYCVEAIGLAKSVENQGNYNWLSIREFEEFITVIYCSF